MTELDNIDLLDVPDELRDSLEEVEVFDRLEEQRMSPKRKPRRNSGGVRIASPSRTFGARNARVRKKKRSEWAEFYSQADEALKRRRKKKGKKKVNESD